jgi:solute carrier family 41
MVASTAMTAACLAGLFLGSFMCFLVVVCRRFGHDPGGSQLFRLWSVFEDFVDNIAPPVAGCMGDLVTLSFVGGVSALLILVIDTPIPFVVGILVVLSASACAIYTLRNPAVKNLIKEGWSPLFGAMVISSGTGIVLDTFVNRYQDFALLAVVISG